MIQYGNLLLGSDHSASSDNDLRASSGTLASEALHLLHSYLCATRLFINEHDRIGALTLHDLVFVLGLTSLHRVLSLVDVFVVPLRRILRRYHVVHEHLLCLLILLLDLFKLQGNSLLLRGLGVVMVVQ